jgi:outer membrane protein assembly factor BamD (BamD/ComL family)
MLAAAATVIRRAIDCISAEKDWRSAESLDTIEAYQDHLAKFPDCDFATLARIKMTQLKKRAARK